MNILFTLVMSTLFGGGEDPKAEPVRLECRSEARLRGSEILLRDIAEITAADKGLAARIADLSFGKRPASGFFRALTREEIEKRLLDAGLGGDRVTVLGSREVALVPVFVPLAAKDVVEVADGILAAALEREPNLGEVTFEAGAVMSLQVPPGRRTLDLKGMLRGGRLEPASAIVDVQILVDDEVWKTVPVAYRLRRFVNAVVVDRPMQKGQPFTDEVLSLKRIEAPNGTLALFSSFEGLQGKVAARNLSGNRPLAPADVAMPSVVWRGDLVTLVSESGRVKLATKARADQDGCIGARILVTNLGSGKVLPATVLGPGVVTIQTR